MITTNTTTNKNENEYTNSKDFPSSNYRKIYCKEGEDCDYNDCGCSPSVDICGLTGGEMSFGCRCELDLDIDETCMYYNTTLCLECYETLEENNMTYISEDGDLCGTCSMCNSEDLFLPDEDELICESCSEISEEAKNTGSNATENYIRMLYKKHIIV